MTRKRQWWKQAAVATGTAALLLAPAGCKKQADTTPAPIVDMNNGPDPAAANLAQPDSTGSTQAAYPAQSYPAQPSQPQQGQVLGARSEGAPTQVNGEQYPETSQQPYDSGQPYAYNDEVDAGEDALAADQPPPPLPVYQQPDLTVAGDEWTPGYWSYGNAGYYWVPGAWVAPPSAGVLWTPGYWGFYNHRYFFHHGYWGRHVGFYGGVPYGFGYTGYGYDGGYWNGNNFYYNRTVNRINTNVVRDVYERRVNEPVGVRISFNGPGGIAVRPRPAEIAVFHESHFAPAQAQIQAQRAAQENRAQFFSANHGQPAVVVRTEHMPADRGATPLPPRQPGQPGNNGAPFNRAGAPQPQPGRGFAPEGQHLPPGGNNPAQQHGNLQFPQQQQRFQQPNQQQREGQFGRPGAPVQQGRPGPGQEHPQPAPQAVPHPEQQQPFQRQRGAQPPQMQQPRPQQQQPSQQQRQAEPAGRPQRPDVAPQARPQPAPQVRPQPAPQARPQPQPAPQARPQPAPQVRPQPAPQARPQPAPQARPQPAPQAARPAPAAEPHGGPPAGAPHEAPHGGGEHPRR